MDVDSITLSAASLGRVFGVSERRVRELRDQGTIPGQPDGRYNLVAAGRAYYASCRPATGRSAAGGVAGLIDFDAARIRLLTEQADAQALRNAQTRGELIDLESTEELFGACLAASRAAFLGLPTRAAAVLTGCTSAGEILRVLTGLVYEALDRLSQTEFVVVDGKLVKKQSANDAESQNNGTVDPENGVDGNENTLIA